MCERLIVMGDGIVVEIVVEVCNAERSCDLQCALALRKLPQAAEQSAGHASREQDLAAVLDPQCLPRDDRQLALLLACGNDGQLVLPSRLRRHAQLREWTDETPRRGRGARRRAELHQALVQIARLVAGGERLHELTRARPQRLLSGGRLDVVLDAAHARQHARDVAVDERRALAKRDRRDRTRRVRPDARHLAQLRRT
jgi:hypothetical protein